MKKKLFRDEYLVNPNCTHYELDPDDTPVPGRYDNYGCDCDCDCPPPPPPHIEPNDANRAYFVHPHPPMGPMPPHIPNVPPQPRFPNARHPIVLPRKAINPPPHDPVLGHYLMPERHYAQWLIEQLKKYPRLDDRCVVEGLWTFCNDIILRNPHSCIDTPAMWHGERLESSIIFADHCCKEIGRINFYRTKSGEAGIALQLGENAVGIKQPNAGDPTTTETFTTYPTADDSAQIARCDWVLAKIQAALDGILDDFLQYVPFDETPTEGSEKGVTSGGVWEAIHDIHLTMDFDDTPTDGSSNPVTSDGIYHFVHDLLPEYGEVEEDSQNPCTGDTIYKYITKVLNKIIGGEDPDPQDPVEIPEIELPVASKQQLGIMQVGEYLSVLSGLVSVDYESLLAQLRIDLGLTAISDAPYGYVSTGFSQLHSNITSIVNSGYSLMKGRTGTGNNYLNPIAYIGAVGANGELTGSTNTTNYGVRLYTSGMSDQETNACIVTCKNTSTNITKRYLPIRTVIVYNGVRHSSGGSEAGGLYWQSVAVRVWYRDYTYTLTAEDITSINNAANTFAGSLSLGVDSGDIS